MWLTMRSSVSHAAEHKPSRLTNDSMVAPAQASRRRHRASQRRHRGIRRHRAAASATGNMTSGCLRLGRVSYMGGGFEGILG